MTYLQTNPPALKLHLIASDQSIIERCGRNKPTDRTFAGRVETSCSFLA